MWQYLLSYLPASNTFLQHTSVHSWWIILQFLIYDTWNNTLSATPVPYIVLMQRSVLKCNVAEHTVRLVTCCTLCCRSLWTFVWLTWMWSATHHDRMPMFLVSSLTHTDKIRMLGTFSRVPTALFSIVRNLFIETVLYFLKCPLLCFNADHCGWCLHLCLYVCVCSNTILTP